MNGREVVMETIKHLETFKENNQYMWIGFMDIHDVSGEENRSILQQSNMSLKYRKKEEEEKTKSVYKTYSPTKIARYREAIKELDVYLGVLFDYIETKFDPSKVVVSLVSDHGQAYLVQSQERILEEERTKVPMMFKGYKKGECNELTEIIDYLPTLLDAAGLKDEYAPVRDGQLPKFFGGSQEREYTYSETIYPGNSYEACLRTKNYKISYQSCNNKVIEDGRIPFNQEFNMNVRNKKTNEMILDDAIYEKYYHVIEEHIKQCRIY